VNPSAIQSAHLNRLAVVYLRQSTPLQVEHYPESRLRQYQLTDRARSFGWARTALPDDRRRSGYFRRPEQQSTGVSPAGLDARPARSGNRLRPGGLASGSQLPGLVPVAGVGRGPEHQLPLPSRVSKVRVGGVDLNNASSNPFSPASGPPGPNPRREYPPLSMATTNACASTCSPSFMSSALPHEQRRCRSLFVNA
jgi:hypothetical protein